MARKSKKVKKEVKGGKERRPITKEELAQYEKLYNSGMGCVKIAKQFNRNPNTVYQTLLLKASDNLEFRFREQGRPISEKELQEWKELYESGIGLSKIAQKFNRNHNVVRQRLIKAGVKMRKSSSRVTNSQKTKIKELREQGYSILRICKEVKLSPQTVSRILKE